MKALLAALAAAALMLGVAQMVNAKDFAPQVDGPQAKAGSGSAAIALPKDKAEALKAAGAAVSAAKAGRWGLAGALAILVLVFLIKTVGVKMGWWAKLGRARYAVVPVLAAAAGLLAHLYGGAGVEASGAIFLACLGASQIEESVNHGARGKQRVGGSS